MITQNVDGLHQAAGARDVIELHGGLDHVVCLDCGARSPRAQLTSGCGRSTASWWREIAQLNPDGDVELADELVASFGLVGCECCGSDLLKPDVVFFGENVPRARVARCFELVERASSLLVLGSSLTVMSGLRFVHRAAAAWDPGRDRQRRDHPRRRVRRRQARRTAGRGPARTGPRLDGVRRAATAGLTRAAHPGLAIW